MVFTQEPSVIIAPLLSTLSTLQTIRLDANYFYFSSISANRFVCYIDNTIPTN